MTSKNLAALPVCLPDVLLYYFAPKYEMDGYAIKTLDK
jgi:hypothetical protein